ncbi:GDSL-type esterase/lipase family protein [Streptomyces sp. NBC_00687]|uniref:GDSL-type esterase/lipase family protein n=1 Tax=Streptomyces sp. NBC_00687 TaxID=2975807 RepID=UPI00225B40FD|nr:GDSL-type esterase/lipase family protein [Streptomyces sp. NBC_00687]MCX4918292.1 SGNH/GDSL hydrolase family protein [Streptomyces sp. NBC_00687]
MPGPGHGRDRTRNEARGEDRIVRRGVRAPGGAPRRAAGDVGAAPADEHADPRCLGPGEGAALLADARWRRAVVLGDSSVDSAGMTVVPGWARAPWTDRVIAALREAHPRFACLHPRGRRELPLSHVRSTQLGDALDFNGDLALLACGGPELRARSFDPDAMEFELSRILAALRGATCQVVLVVSPFDLTQAGEVPADHVAGLRARQRLLSERIEAVVLRHGCVHVDLAAHEGPPAGDLWGARPGRLSSRGHAVAAAAVVRTLGRLLAT